MQKQLVGVMILAAFTAVCVAADDAAAQDVPGNAIEKMERAMPKRPRVKPARPRKMLVFSLCRGFVHGSIPYGKKALEIMGKTTGAFEAVISDDIAMFEPANIKQFDAICMNNTTQNVFLPKDIDKLPQAEQAAARQRETKLKESFAAYVRSGGGLVGIHAATDTFYEWAEYGKMMGGYFSGHPWHERIYVKNDSPGSPINAVFKGGGFAITDEIYQFRDPYSREALHVLLSLDTTKTNMNKKGIKRKDGDFAVSWVRSYGDGRVFYCSLGHRNEIFWEPAILQHYLDGIQFAMGDLKADTRPSAQAGGGEGVWHDLLEGNVGLTWTCKKGSWTIKEGVLTRQGGDYVWTNTRYGDFVLDLEFKVATGTNSGDFIPTDTTADPVQTGIEIQILDSYGKKNPGKHDCGSIYDCLAPSSNPTKAAGQWNRMIITCKGPNIKVEMNGVQIVDMDLNKWTEPNKNPDGSKNKFITPYKNMPRSGHIGFQDHGKPVWFRNIKVKPI